MSSLIIKGQFPFLFLFFVVVFAFLPLDNLGGKMEQTQALKRDLRLNLCPGTF